jgi:hypothetical protein
MPDTQRKAKLKKEEALSESVVPTAEKVLAPKQESEPETKKRAVDS